MVKQDKEYLCDMHLIFYISIILFFSQKFNKTMPFAICFYGLLKSWNFLMGATF